MSSESKQTKKKIFGESIQTLGNSIPQFLMLNPDPFGLRNRVESQQINAGGVLFSTGH